MWNKKKEEDYPPKTSATVPAASSVSKESNPTMSSPTPSYSGMESRGSAVIGKSVMIKGQIFSREDLTIDGEVEGSVELQEHRLTVGPHGKVQAGVKAHEIIVLGTIHGNVDAADRIEIRKDARLVGDIKTARIVIEDGAYFKGSIDIQRPEVARPAPAPRPAAPAQAAPVAASAGATATAPAPAAASQAKPVS
jgi:cytoskeletal protein CcmA (bactofilin family)